MSHTTEVFVAGKNSVNALRVHIGMLESQLTAAKAKNKEARELLKRIKGLHQGLPLYLYGEITQVLAEQGD